MNPQPIPDTKMKSRIRNFDRPQTFICLLAFTKRRSYMERKLREMCPEIDQALTEKVCLDTKIELPITVKIQRTRFIKPLSNPVSFDELSGQIKKNQSLRPCSLSTVARLLLDKEILSEIPDKISIEFCLAYTVDGWYEVDLKNGWMRPSKPNPVHSSTPIIMESDPI